MNKKILYLDMDGVIADFDLVIKKISPELANSTYFLNYETRLKKEREIIENNLDLFYNLPPYEGAIDAVNQLFELFDIYFLSSPIWDVPESFIWKRIWIEKVFGDKAKRRLILTHRKDLNIGDYLVDDRLKNGASKFIGEHIHFGTDKFPNWACTLKYLQSVA